MKLRSIPIAAFATALAGCLSLSGQATADTQIPAPRALFILATHERDSIQEVTSLTSKLEEGSYIVARLELVGDGGSRTQSTELRDFIRESQARSPGLPTLLYGHGIGAAIALDAALEHPERTIDWGEKLNLAGAIFSAPAKNAAGYPSSGLSAHTPYGVDFPITIIHQQKHVLAEWSGAPQFLSENVRAANPERQRFTWQAFIAEGYRNADLGHPEYVKAVVEYANRMALENYVPVLYPKSTVQLAYKHLLFPNGVVLGPLMRLTRWLYGKRTISPLTVEVRGSHARRRIHRIVR